MSITERVRTWWSALRSGNPIVTVERTCSRCHQADEVQAGHYVIFQESLWCETCYGRARGGTVARPEPIREADQLPWVN